MGLNNIKRLTLNLDDYIIKIAEEKAKVMFKGNVDNYINWLICSNNKQEVKRAVNGIEKKPDEKKPVPIPDTSKTAIIMYVIFANCLFIKEKRFAKQRDTKIIYTGNAARKIEIQKTVIEAVFYFWMTYKLY